tara:strand:- start:127 stop:291 length:165 start_codon:yes stop_codon:yes gene_type:complete
VIVIIGGIMRKSSQLFLSRVDGDGLGHPELVLVEANGLQMRRIKRTEEEQKVGT